MVAVRQGPRFFTRYLDILRAQVRERLGVSLITLTDMEDTPGDTLPLHTDLRGWWAKMELFAPWNENIRPCLYLDLDTYLINDCREMLNDPGDRLLMLRDFNVPDRPASGVMIIPKETPVWDNWRGDCSSRHGDQGFIGKFCEGFLQDRYDGIVSYKKALQIQNPDLSGVKICCFHGKPKPHETDGWARGIWDRG